MKDLDFRRITLKCENEPSMKVFRESMSHLIVKETERQYRSLRTSEECSTNVKITNDISRLNWIPHFAVKLLHKRRIDRRWKKPRLQFGIQIWFQKNGEEGINSTLKRRTQGIFVGHQDRTRAILYIAKSGSMRCHSWIRQTLSDAREPMNLENWFGGLVPVATGSRVMTTETKLANRWQMMNPELKLTKRVTADEEGMRFMMPRIVVEKPREVERRRFYVLSSDSEENGHVGSCPGYELLTSQGEAIKSCRYEFRERIGTIVESILAGEARRETCKDRVAERERDREMRRARIEPGAGDVPEVPREKDDEQVAVRHADASGGYIIENQHEEKRKRDIQVNERGSEATNEEQTVEWRKTVRSEQEAPNTSVSSDPYVALEHHVTDETPSRLGSVLVQKLSHVEDDEHTSAFDVFYEKDGREDRCI